MICVDTIPAGLLGANCYVLSLPGRNDCVVVDPGGEEVAKALCASGRKPAVIIATHGHFDHIGGVDALCGIDVPFYIGSGDRDFPENDLWNASSSFGEALHIQTVASLLSDGDTFTAAGIRFTALETPGHTPGSICLRAEDLLFTGDTLFARGFGRTDLPLGSAADLRRSLRRLLRDLEGDYIVYPGHGDKTTLETERQYYR